MTPEIAVEKLVKLVRRVAWSPKSGLALGTRAALREALATYEAVKAKPTVYDHLLNEAEDPYEGNPSVPTCKHCKQPFKPRKKGQKFCTSTCRVQNWKEQQAPNEAGR